MPSVTPNYFLSFSDDLSFWERLANLFVLLSSICGHYFYDISDTSESVTQRPVLSITELFKQSELFFVNIDNSCAEYPKLTASNLKFLPGASVSDPKPLPKELEEFIDGSGRHGTIIATFGTLKHVRKAYIPRMLERLFQVFERLPQRIIMAADPVKDRRVPKNVLISNWLPQNDLLAHPKVKLFITHGGSNGQLEAIHHAVPMLAMGKDWDQVYNNQKMEMKGFGKYISAKHFTADELYDAIKEIMGNVIYKDNLKKCSEIIHNLPSAKEIVTSWVNHILKFGGAHLRPKSLDIPLYKLFMLDVLLFISVVVILLFVTLIYSCKCTIRLCKRNVFKKKQD